MKCQKEGEVTYRGSVQEGLREVRDLVLRTSVREFSGKRTTHCKPLSDEAAFLQCLRDSDKPKWPERENK